MLNKLPQLALSSTTSEIVIGQVAEILVTGKLGGYDVDFFVIHGDFTQEYMEAFKERLAERIVSISECTITEPVSYNSPYFAVFREDGSSGCLRMFHQNQMLKGVRWDDKRPVLAIILRKKGSTANLDESIYASILPCLTIHSHGIIDIEVDDGA